MQGVIQYLWFALFAVFGLCIAFNDLKFHRVPNKLLLLAILVQSVWLAAAALGWMPPSFAQVEWLSAVMGFGVGMAVFYPLWRFRAIGAGDVKLIATLGFLLGLPNLLPTVLLGSVLAGLHATSLVFIQGWSVATTAWTQKQSRRGVPYGAYLALAAIAQFAWLIWTSHAV